MMLAARGIFLAARRNRKPTAKSYVQDGLVAMWDGIENAGFGVHDANATTWKDLVGTNHITLTNGSWTDVSLVCNGTTTGALAHSESVRKGSIEIVCAFGKTGVAQLVFNAEYDSYNGGFSLRANGTVNFSINGKCFQASHPTDKTYYACIYDGDRYGKILYEDALSKTSLGTGANFAVPGCGISRRWQYMFYGEICRIGLYSRAVTAEEIAANYAVDKERFNLPDAT